MNFYQIVALVGTVLTVLFGYLALKNRNRQDDRQSGAQTAAVLTEIGYIKGGVDDIKRQQEKQTEQHLEVVTRLTAVEGSVKSAHRRIDGLEKTGKGRS